MGERARLDVPGCGDPYSGIGCVTEGCTHGYGQRGDRCAECLTDPCECDGDPILNLIDPFGQETGR